EKVIIKWAGFVLIGLDTIFSILNSFVSVSSRSAPRKFQDAIPALSYLFTLSLNLIYAAWIIYYSLSKRRYAFFHPKMRNICLVALLSYVAVLIPVVFFILDISIYDVAGWGNYVRWVGAAAASVVVWEWVERIEALERDERKDGILGREIFDGDEMLEATPSSAAPWSNAGTSNGGRGSDRGPTTSINRGGADTIARRFRRRRPRSRQGTIHTSRLPSSHMMSDYNTSCAPQSPRPTASPFSPFSEDGSISPDAANRASSGNLDRIVEFSPHPRQEQSDSTSSDTPDKPVSLEPESQRKNQSTTSNFGTVFWNTVQRLPIPFLNRHMSPPIEVKQAVRSSQPVKAPAHQPPTKQQSTGTSAHTLLDRIGFKKTAPAPKGPLPVTVVPAPANNRTSWNDVRSYADNEPQSRQTSLYALTPTVSQDVAMDQQSRRSTPVIGSADRRRSSVPSQMYRLSRGTMTPMIMEDDGPGEQAGVADTDPLSISRERDHSRAEHANSPNVSPPNATDQDAEEKPESKDMRSEPLPSRRPRNMSVLSAKPRLSGDEVADASRDASHFDSTLPNFFEHTTFAVTRTASAVVPLTNNMSALVDDLNETFALESTKELPPDVSGELQSICRLHSISAQELFYKWEYYSMKMGAEKTQLDLPTVRAFKKDLQEMVEREARSKSHADKRGTYGTPRNAARGGDMLGLIEGITPVQTSASGGNKRKAAFETPSVPKSSKANGMSSPSDGRSWPASTDQTSQSFTFPERQNPGQIIETLNGHLAVHEPPIAPHAEPRVKLMANTDLKKFRYRPMAMHLSEASEVLDDRIDEFQSLIQTHHNLDDSVFGNAAAQGTNEVIAVGRIASDSLEGKLNPASILLEMSRRTGAGLRVPLKVDSLQYEFFPGQIVAVKGINASGNSFVASEILEIPLLAPAASRPSILQNFNGRLGATDDDGDHTSPSKALNIIVASGPYTADDNLAFEPLHALCEKCIETSADMLILIGPLFDTEHPLLASGDFDLPDDPMLEPDRATLTDAFRILVAKPLQSLAAAIPSITIVCVPSTRDLMSKHVSWPQDNLPGKKLGLPKQMKMVSNPVTVSINEMVVAISAQDILYELRREEVVVGNNKAREGNGGLLARLPRHLIQQRHFFPLYPPVNRQDLPKPGIEGGVATGMPLDPAYLKLGEWLQARPDILIQPSALPQFAKV
ncbi:MAG: hypothetical protein Q9174_005329, partial [Haloplaca sp. 1 TL-2023]